MDAILENKIFNIVLLLTILGEFFIPWLLKHFYEGYNSKTMVMSALGSPESPVRYLYNIWLIWLGCFLLFTALVLFNNIKQLSLPLAILTFLSIATFAIGAGLLAGIFSVNESKNVVTLASKIHGIGSAIGFMCLLFFPLLNAIVSFKEGNIHLGILYIIVFIFALAFFTCFILGDKESFKNTIFAYEGLWERLTLFTMYIPFIYSGISKLFSLKVY